MPATAANLVTYRSSQVPMDDFAPSGGSIDVGSGPISQEVAGGLFPTEPAPESENEVWRYKACRKNEHATDSVYDIKVLILNGLIASHAAGTASIRAANPDETGKVRVYGKVDGINRTEDIEFASPATSPSSGVLTFDQNTVMRAQNLTSGGALSNAGSDVIIAAAGEDQGKIPRGWSGATGEFEIGIDAAPNSGSSSANRLSDPVGISFSKAFNEASAIDGPDELQAGEYLGYWLRFTRIAGMRSPVGFIQPIVRFLGADS